MSVCYATRGLISLETAIELLEEWGCTVEPSEDNDETPVTVLDPDGNWFHLTGIEDETARVLGTAYGLIDKDPQMMADILDMAAEGEEDYEEIIGWLEEREDDASQ